uniref:Uncharacterized protein n=1 Tax=Tanacetum cinerariifolium TaxID=118510 RepID=A0A699IBS4_TANCI|nr:hypothetical protein [Tanacetum cinerariifolium]
MKESIAYKTYLGYAIGTVPPKVARKFNKASPSKKDSVPELADEEPVQKGKRVKRSTKKSSTTTTTCIVIREPPVETQKKSLRDFHKSHPSGSGSVAKKPPSVEKITPPVINEDDSNDENDSKNKDNDEENKSDDDETPSNSEKGSDSEQDTDGSESDSKSNQQDDDDEDDDNDDDDKSEVDEDRGIDNDDVQDKKADVRMTDA